MEAKLVPGQIWGREDNAYKHFQAKILLFVLPLPVMLADFHFSQSITYYYYFLTKKKS